MKEFEPSNTPDQLPALLVSYVYLAPFLKNRDKFNYRNWVLDSGAFSAHYSGNGINLLEYTETAKRLLEEDKTLVEVFALDVIGDSKASIKNCEFMNQRGVPAIPCFHRGSNEADLTAIARDYPKIALGGVARLKGSAKMNFAEQAFARIWPKKVHGFGFGADSQVMGLPWHSVDATNWEIGPTKFGRWKRFGAMSVRGSNQNLKSEIIFSLALERRARAKWSKQMDILNTEGPTVRLAEIGTGRLLKQKI